jgi:hypothetical protein
MAGKVCFLKKALDRFCGSVYFADISEISRSKLRDLTERKGQTMIQDKPSHDRQMTGRKGLEVCLFTRL